MNYLLGIDLGTSGTKTVLFDEKGTAIASHSIEYPIIQIQNGWAEQDAHLWWEATVQTIQKVLKDSKISPESVKGVGISGQMHGLVLLDKNGEVLRNSIIWCDGRTSAECAEITEKIGAKRLIEITANPALTGFTAGKILWVRKHEPEIYAKTVQILLPKDYVRYKLTGIFATDVSDASGMNLLDLGKRDWSAEIFEKLDLDPTLFPKVYESPDVIGKITPEISKLTGLSTETVVVAGAGDNAAAAVGMGVVEEGKAFTTIGTSGVVFAHSNQISIDPEGRVHTFGAAVPNAYTVMSCTLSAGLSLKWMRDTLCQSEVAQAKKEGCDPYEIMTEEAKSSPIGANHLLFMPYLMGERSPILDEKARGCFIGLSAIHNKNDLIRAVMEGVIYSQKHCLDVLEEMNVAPETMLACGGGGTSPLWRQMLADVFACPVATAENQQGPALGVAILAGVGAGIYPSVAEGCKAVLSFKEAQNPIPENTEKYGKFYEIYRELYPCLKETYLKLAEL
ncbi:MAG: xylulokinase [Eubacteriales bacterium]